jgi:hypothetical protein
VHQFRLLFSWNGDGKEIKPKSNAASSNTWVWNGSELKPKNSPSSSNTWVIEGNKAKPKVNPNSSNTYEVGSSHILVIAGKLVLRLF